MLNPATRRFDAEWTLSELLAAAPRAVLQEALAALGGASLLETDGRTVLGPDPTAKARRMPLGSEIEPLGYLAADTGDAPTLRAVAALVQLALRAEQRYRMAADLHQEAVHADYQALQEKHAALQESEARYKALAERLQERVQEQVKVIETAQRQLYQAEKLASVGQLAAGVAHEINTPIGFIKSNLTTAQSYLDQISGYRHALKADARSAWNTLALDEVLADFAALLRESHDGATRIARIVADLKGFSRVDNPEQEIADVNEILRGVCQVAASQVRERAEVVLELSPLPSLRCHAARLGQTFLNLLLNAAQAMERRGAIRIATEHRDGLIRIRFADDGKGIPPDVLPRVFDPFFTTKDVGQGTGLGLTVCSDVVKMHGGRIGVESAPGRGATFTIELPVRS